MMSTTESPLVSVGLPVRNGAGCVGDVVRSVLEQDYPNIELIICDNASTDSTESVCRELASGDSRIRYHRQATNIGLLGNFISAIHLANGEFFRWIGDDDWLAPTYVSRCLASFAEVDSRILVTSWIGYIDRTGAERSDVSYRGAAMESEDPVVRFAEMLRLLNEGPLVVDPLYAMMRRAPVAAIERRNIIREDQVFATKLAIAGPWGHVPEMLAWRNMSSDKIGEVRKLLGVPAWHAYCASTVAAREMLRWISASELEPTQRRDARVAVARMYARRQRITYARALRKLARVGRVGIESALHTAQRQ